MKKEIALNLIKYANENWKASFNYDDEIEEEAERIMNDKEHLNTYIELLNEDITTATEEYHTTNEQAESLIKELSNI
jgi:hypothetical protein